MATTPQIASCHKNVLLALLEGWSLRYVDGRGWCLFATGRPRPFATVRTSIVDEMTAADWLSPSVAPTSAEPHLVKRLTMIGHRIAAAIDREDQDLIEPKIDVHAPFRPDFMEFVGRRQAA